MKTDINGVRLLVTMFRFQLFLGCRSV